MVGNKVSMLTKAIARSFDLDDDGVMEKAVEQGGGNNRVTEHRRTPPILIGWYHTSRSRTRVIFFSDIDLRSSRSVRGAALLMSLSS